MLLGFLIGILSIQVPVIYLLRNCAKQHNVYKCVVAYEPVGISGFKESEVLDPPPEQSK